MFLQGLTTYIHILYWEVLNLQAHPKCSSAQYAERILTKIGKAQNKTFVG